MDQINECIKGNHDLIEVHRTYHTYDEEQVVRWCRTCGSVVVDIDIDRDGRTKAGAIMKMKAPQTYKWKWVR